MSAALKDLNQTKPYKNRYETIPATYSCSLYTTTKKEEFVLFPQLTQEIFYKFIGFNNNNNNNNIIYEFMNFREPIGILNIFFV